MDDTWKKTDEARWPSHPLTEILCKLHTLSFELANHAPQLGKHSLNAARVLEGIRDCLQQPSQEKLKRLARAATDLAGKTSRLPRSREENKRAAMALKDAVEDSLNRYPTAFTDAKQQMESSEAIATRLEVARTTYAYMGAKRVLPHGGTAEERIAIFTEVIEKKVRPFTDAGQKMDPETIIKACHKACGGKGQPFRAEQRQSVRRRVREQEKRKALKGQ